MTHPRQGPQRFTGRAGDYARNRPGYPLEAVQWLIDEFGLSPDRSVAELGSGTGIWTERLLEVGCSVWAVEPNAEMRGEAERRFADRRRFTSVAGSAEATTLPDRCADFVCAAQAIHWFVIPAAIDEIRRIAKPGAPVAILANDRRSTGTPFLEDYEDLLERRCAEYETIRRRERDRSRLREILGEDYRSQAFINRHDLDADGLLGLARSASYAPPPNHPEHAPFHAELRAIFAERQREGRVTVEYFTWVFAARGS
jgi:SAM-dependent methyltransferase